MATYDLDLNDAMLPVDLPRLILVKGENVTGRGQNDDGAVACGDPYDFDVLFVEGRDQLRMQDRLVAFEMAQLACVQPPREHRVLGPEERVESCCSDADRDQPLGLCAAFQTLADLVSEKSFALKDIELNQVWLNVKC